MNNQPKVSAPSLTGVDINRMLSDLSEARYKVREISEMLTQYLMSTSISISDAIISGLVRPNFPTSEGFRRHLRERRRDL